MKVEKKSELIGRGGVHRRPVREVHFLRYKVIGSSKKFKNWPRPLSMPRTNHTSYQKPVPLKSRRYLVFVRENTCWVNCIYCVELWPGFCQLTVTLWLGLSPPSIRICIYLGAKYSNPTHHAPLKIYSLAIRSVILHLRFFSLICFKNDKGKTIYRHPPSLPFFYCKNILYKSQWFFWQCTHGAMLNILDAW